MSRFSLTVRVLLMLFASSAACTMSIAGGTDAAPTASSRTSADPTAPASGTNVGINEIVVTAQKWSQSIDTVGMAITALTGDQLQMHGVAHGAGLSKSEPGFLLARSNSGSPAY